MFDYVIDYVQGTKKTLTNSMVKDEKVRESFIGFIDAQTAFAKAALKAGEAVGKSLNIADLTKQFSAYGK